jgi:hypothetical protein
MREVSGGKAHGADRTYQEFCRDVLRKNDDTLVPFSGDGIDVTLDAAGSRWTFDVALHVPGVRLIVAECKRHAARVKQDHVAAFAFKVDRHRQAMGLPVAGAFFTKTQYQVGAVRSGQYEGISMAVVGDRETIAEGFAIQYHRWDAATGKRVRDVTLHVGAPATFRVTGSDVRLLLGRARTKPEE